MKDTTEYWLRGPLPNVPVLLEPVAHALKQANAEIEELMEHFPDSLLWLQPFSMASVGFHLQHIAGVQDRLFTYANGNALSEEQLKSLAQEGKAAVDTSVAQLVNALTERTERSIAYLANTDIATLTEERGVGRKKIPSTKIGLLVHAAEHTMRHTGQLLVTATLLLHQTAQEAKTHPANS